MGILRIAILLIFILIGCDGQKAHDCHTSAGCFKEQFRKNTSAYTHMMLKEKTQCFGVWGDYAKECE